MRRAIFLVVWLAFMASVICLALEAERGGRGVARGWRRAGRWLREKVSPNKHRPFCAVRWVVGGPRGPLASHALCSA